MANVEQTSQIRNMDSAKGAAVVPIGWNGPGSSSYLLSLPSSQLQALGEYSDELNRVKFLPSRHFPSSGARQKINKINKNEVYRTVISGREITEQGKRNQD